MQAQYFSSVLPERSAISLRLHRLGQLCPEIPEIAVVRLLNISVWGIKKNPQTLRVDILTDSVFSENLRVNLLSGIKSEYIWVNILSASIEKQERLRLSEPSRELLLLRWIFYRQSKANTLVSLLSKIKSEYFWVTLKANVYRIKFT